MHFTTTIFAALSATIALVAARPVPYVMPPAIRIVARQAIFPPTPYSSVQISDGVAGNGEAEAAAVCIGLCYDVLIKNLVLTYHCLEPFAGIDLATVDAESLENLAVLRKAAEEAESDFNDAIDAAEGAAKAALNIGKASNFFELDSKNDPANKTVD